MPPDQPQPPPKPVAAEPDSSVEHGLLVFTVADHIKRGSCCGSGCRHCPYEPRHPVKFRSAILAAVVCAG
ncbi:MAG: hypothetical protein EBX35_09100 [Planctomycetia bacterium]|nr:hypothetical protein [Planctomycetia bacterium]